MFHLLGDLFNLPLFCQICMGWQ